MAKLIFLGGAFDGTEFSSDFLAEEKALDFEFFSTGTRYIYSRQESTWVDGEKVVYFRHTGFKSLEGTK